MPNYIVRPTTGEVFPAERWEDFKLDRSLRIATDDEQAAIVSGRDFREVTRAAEAVIDPQLLDPAGRFGSTTIDLPPELTPYAVQPEQVGAEKQVTMEVALGRIPAGEPGRVVFESDAAQPAGAPGLADQLEAVEAMDSLDEIRTTAAQLEVEVGEAESIDGAKAKLKRRLIQLANESAAQKPVTLAESLASVDKMSSAELATAIAELGVEVKEGAKEPQKRAALKRALTQRYEAATVTQGAA